MQPLTAYDEIPYPGGAYQQSHIDRLETLATLFGMTPPDIRSCRVLELGCADGSNIIPMACALPGSRFTGIDLSARQIQPGLETIRALGLRNIELRQADIRDVDDRFGAFDYIIAHGVYSWVPVEVQDHILRLCYERLSPSGVAYISYNTYPGWRMRGMLRDMMLYHARKFENRQEQIEQARALINWLAEIIRAENSPYGLLLKRELEQMQKWPNAYFRHDSLAEINEPVYFHQFVEHAEQHGLQFLAEAEFPSMIAGNYGAPVDETLNRLSRNIIEMEQYMDFVRNRLFRQTLLCRRDVKLSRSLGPWNLTDLHVAARLSAANPEMDLNSTEPEVFHGVGDLKVSTSQPVVKAALYCLTERWPAATAFSDLLLRARSLLKHKDDGCTPSGSGETDGATLGSVLLTCFTRGLCELYAHPPEFVIAPGLRPMACPFARLQARSREMVINRRHEGVPLNALAKQLLPLLDGGQDCDSMLDALIRLAADGTLLVKVAERLVSERGEARQILAGELERELARFGRTALLVG